MCAAKWSRESRGREAVIDFTGHGASIIYQRRQVIDDASSCQSLLRRLASLWKLSGARLSFRYQTESMASETGSRCAF
jgi:hypothetical protein